MGPEGRSVPKVLVVDDEELIRWSLRERLESEGYEVVDAASATSALERAPATDLAVVDRRLPDGDGLALAAALHRIRPGRPVILMTSFDTAELEAVAPGLGIDAVVQKPFDLDTILELIESGLGRS